MLTRDELKIWLHRKELSKTDKLLLVLATFDKPCQVAAIKEAANHAGLRIAPSWNVSLLLTRSAGQAIRTPAGWEITEPGRQHLRNLGVSKISQAAVNVAVDLRALLAKISDPITRSYVEEAIKCYELEFNRSAVVMSWLAAVHVLYQHVIKSHLAAFNAEARRVDIKWKNATTADDLCRMKEKDFLDRLAAISVIGKSVKTELVRCLDLRNGCGHPSSLKIGANSVANHLEVLLLNVFEKFQ